MSFTLPLRRTLHALMPGFIQRSLRAKLFTTFTIVLGAMVLFALLRLPVDLEQHAMNGVRHKAESVAAMAAYSVAPALMFEDEQAVDDVVRSVSGIRNIAYVVITNSVGQAVGALNSDVALESDAGESTGVTRDGEVFRSRAAIVGTDGRRAGTVRIGFYLADVEQEVASMRTRVLVYGIVLFMLGLIVVYFMAGYITAPLQTMVRTMGRVAAGDLTPRVNFHGTDELGFVAQSFDTMVDKLDIAYEELQENNRTLERRVESRTLALRAEADERLRAEGAHRESEQRFRAMFDAAGVGIALADSSARVLDANPALCTMLGHEANSITPPDVRVYHEDEAIAKAEFRKLLDGRAQSVQFEVRILGKDDHPVWTHTVAARIAGNPGDEPLIIAMIEDISEKRRLAEMYRQSQKLEAVGSLAGGIAHDFNNLLTTINGTADLVLEDLAEGSLRDDIQEIRLAGERAAGLTRQMLAFSRKQMLQPSVLDLNTIITEMGRLLERLIGEDLHLTTRTAIGLPAVKADRSQIEQVIMNLAVNARDAMPAGGRLTIETSAAYMNREQAARHNLQAGRYVMLEVRDTGVGMDASTQARMFEPFFTTKKVGEGTGLGLATVYGIVTQSGGSIDVQSELDHGTTFSILLPACDHDGAPIVSVSESHVSGSETILLIEDEMHVRKLLRRVLVRSGYTVIEASNGRKGVDAARKFKGDIQMVLSDVVMPEMSGPDAVERILAERPNIKVLFMSGYTEDIMIRQGISTNTLNYLQKPVLPFDLTHRVREILDGVRAQEAAD